MPPIIWQLLLLGGCATAFVAPPIRNSAVRVARPPQSRNSVGRIAPLNAVDVSSWVDVSTTLAPLSESTLVVASFQDFRDSITDIVRPFAIFAALPAFGIALIPVTLATSLARAVATPAARVAEILESIPADQWQKLLLCVAFDAAGDLSESLPFHGLLELALGPLDFFVLQYLFEGSFAIPVAGLLEEWLPIPVEFLPTATLAWCVQNLAAESVIAKRLGLVKKKPRPVQASTGYVLCRCKSAGNLRASDDGEEGVGVDF